MVRYVVHWKWSIGKDYSRHRSMFMNEQDARDLVKLLNKSQNMYYLAFSIDKV